MLQGHGQSDGERAHVEKFSHYVEDFQQYIRHVLSKDPSLADIPKFLLGHSFGGLIVVHVCLSQDSSTLGLSGAILLSPQLTPVPSASTMSLSFKSKLSPKSSMSYAPAPENSHLSHDEHVCVEYEEDPLVYKGALKARFTAEAIAATKHSFQHASEMAVPYLIVHGSANEICKPERSWGWHEQTTCEKFYVQIKDARHELHNEAEPWLTSVRDEMAEFLDRILKKTSF